MASVSNVLRLATAAALLFSAGLAPGNPVQNIEDVENVQLVFKDGVGFDPVKLTQSVQALVAQR